MGRKEEESISRFIDASISIDGRARASLVCTLICQHPDECACPTRSMRNHAQDPHENTMFREITLKSQKQQLQQRLAPHSPGKARHSSVLFLGSLAQEAPLDGNTLPSPTH